MKRLYIDTTAFQLIDSFSEYVINGNAASLLGRGLSARSLADLKALRVIYELALRSEVHVVIGPAALYEVGPPKRVERIAAAYAMAGTAARLFPCDEGSFANTPELDSFADVQALCNISLKDRRIFVDALLNECDAVITCDYHLIRAMDNVHSDYRRIPFLSPSTWIDHQRAVAQREAERTT